MKQAQPRENNLGPWGWLWGGRYGIERYLYFLHRITALGLILFITIHLILTTFLRIQGQDIWAGNMAVLHHPIFKFGEYLVAVAFVYHTLNGLRLTIQELGIGLGKPTAITYPYRDALRKRRGWTYAMLGGVIVVVLVFLVAAYVL